MHTSHERLNYLLQSFDQVPMLVIGDVILDHYVWGKVERVSPEAPVVVVQVEKEEYRLGGAANVAHNLQSLGAVVDLCGLVGPDEGSKVISEKLQELGIKHSALLTDPLRKTTTKTRVIAHSQQVVRIDREDTDAISANLASEFASVVECKLTTAKGVIVSDYGKGVISAKLFDCFAKHRQIPVLVDPKSPHFDLYATATIIKPNRKEAEEASGRKIKNRGDAVDVAKILLENWKCAMVLITLGEDGMVLVAKSINQSLDHAYEGIEVETKARKVYDVSGAGDTVSAVFALALAVGATHQEAAILSNLAAGVVVGEIGTVPVSKDKLAKEVNS